MFRSYDYCFFSLRQMIKLWIHLSSFHPVSSHCYLLIYFTLLIYLYIYYCVFPSRSVFWTDNQKFFRNVLSEKCDQDRTYFIGYSKKSFRKKIFEAVVRDACGAWHSMSSAENNNGGSNWAYTVADITHLR